MIEGVLIEPLRVIADELGAVLHMLRSDSASFTRFGEIYFSEINPGAVKAWKRHRTMTQRLAVPVGRIRIVLYDDRPGSPTAGATLRHELGRPDAYALLTIPPGVWYGWESLSAQASLMANCADETHNPEEAEHVDVLTALPQEWRKTT